MIAVNWWATARGLELAYTLFDARRIVWLPSSESRTTHLRITLAYLVAEVLGGPVPSLIKIGIASTFSLLRQIHVLKLRPPLSAPYSPYVTIAIIAFRSLALVGAFFILSKGNVLMYGIGTIALVSLVAWHVFLSKPPQKNAEELSAAIDDLRQKATTLSPSRVQQLEMEIRAGCDPAMTPDEKVRSIFQATSKKFEDVRNVAALEMDAKNCLQRLRAQFKDRLEAFADPLDPKKINLEGGGFAQADIEELDRIEMAAFVFKSCRGTCDQIEKEIADFKNDWEKTVIFRRLHTLFSLTKFTDWPLVKLSPWLDKMQRTRKDQLFDTLNRRIAFETAYVQREKLVTVILTYQQLVKIKTSAERHFSINLNSFEEAVVNRLKAVVTNAEREIEKKDDGSSEFFQVQALMALHEARGACNAFPEEIQTSVEKLKLEAAQGLERFLLQPVSLESLTRFCRELVKVWMIYDFLEQGSILMPKLKQRFDLIDPQLVGKLSSQLKELQGSKQVRAAVAAISQNFSQFASIELSVAVDQLLDAAKIEDLSRVSEYQRKATDQEQSATEDGTRAMYRDVLSKVAKAQRVVDLHETMKACIGRLELQFRDRLQASVDPLSLQEINLKAGGFLQADIEELDRVRTEVNTLDVCRGICDQIENEIATFENRWKEEVIYGWLRKLFSKVNASDWPAKGLSSFLKEMQDLNPSRYTQLQDFFVSRTTGSISLTNSPDFQQIVTNYQDILKMREAVDNHYQVDLGSFVVAASKCLEKLAVEAEKEIENHDSTSSDFLQLNRLRTFCQASVALVKISPQGITKPRERLRTKAEEYLTVFTTATTPEIKASEQTAKKLVKLWMIFDALELANLLEEKLKVIFKGKGKEWKGTLGGQLKILLGHNDVSVRSAAHTITETFPDFDSIRIGLLNKLTEGVTFDKALEELKIDPELIPGQQDLLKDLGRQFNEFYQAHLKAIAEKTFNAPQNIARAKDLAKKVKGHFEQNMVAAIIQRITTDRVRQNQGYLVELVSCIFAQWTFIHSERTPSGEIESLSQPHQTQVLAIFQLIGLNKDKWPPNNHICEVRTGEGKSITFGVCSILFSLLGYSVKVVCFSKYLSSRDQKSFQTLFTSFGINNDDKGIRYLSISELAGSVTVNLFQGMDKSITGFFKNSTHTEPKTNSNDKSVLLIDEIDVLLDDSFFGCCSGFGETLSSDCVRRLLRNIWERREELKGKSKDVAIIDQMKQSELVQGVLRDFPKLDSFIEKELSTMISDLAWTTKCINEKKYIVKEDGKIYFQGAGGNLISNGYSYSLAFAYLYFEESTTHPVDKDALNQHLCILIIYSRLRYNALLQHFSVRLGITGTFQQLSEGEKDLLKGLGFNEMSVIPTTYQKQKLQEEALVVVGGGIDLYHKAIRNRCEEVCEDNRACLIIFDNEDDLEKYSDYLSHQISSAKVEKLGRNSDDGEKTRVVSQAIRQRGVTLMTRSYGRGTDFYCHDEAINLRGGVHVIVTFFPDTKSDEVQFKGRTCRQNNKGSFGFILWDENLLEKKYVEGKISAADNKVHPDIDDYKKSDWYTIFDQKRQEKLKTRVEELKAKDTKSEDMDHATHQLARLLGTQDDGAIVETLKQVHYQ